MSSVRIPYTTADATIESLIRRQSDGYVWNGTTYVNESTDLDDDGLEAVVIAATEKKTKDDLTTTGYNVAIPAGVVVPVVIEHFLGGLTAGNTPTWTAEYDPTDEQILEDTAQIGVAGAGLSAIPDMATATNQATIAGYIDTEVTAIVNALTAAQSDLDTITDTGVTATDITQAALAKFLTADTGETTAATGSVGKIAQGAAGNGLAESSTVDGVPILVALAAMQASLVNEAEPTASGVNFKNRAGTDDLVEVTLGTTRGERTSSTINEEAVAE